MNKEGIRFKGKIDPFAFHFTVMNSNHLCSLVEAFRVPHMINIAISARVTLHYDYEINSTQSIAASVKIVKTVKHRQQSKAFGIS